MKTFIYSLTDPITNQIRYVGKTVNLEQRLYNHINHAKTLTTPTTKVSGILSTALT